jgi:hypothetical protein
MRAPRSFPSPWKVAEIPGGFRIQDATGRTLAYVYFHRESSGRDDELLTYYEAQKLADSIAQLPDGHDPPSQSEE